MSKQMRQEKAASILAHYFRRITEAAGLRWSERNETDMEQLAELICGSGEDRDPRPKLPPVEEHIDDKDWINQRAQAVGYATTRPKRRNDR